MAPYLSLLHATAVKFEDLGLRVARMNKFDLSNWKNIDVLMVSMEQVSHQRRYFTVIDGLNRVNAIARFVLDECHIYPRSKFREKSLSLRHIFANSKRFPLVFLSATLPSYVFHDLCKLIQIKPSSICIIREPFGQMNLKYIIERLHHSDIKTLISRTVKCLNTSFREYINTSDQHPSRKVLLLFLTKGDIERVQSHLLSSAKERKIFGDNTQILCYHSDLTEDERHANQKCWKESDKNMKIMLATESFSTGIDVLDVREVIVVGGARSIIQLAQVAGRAGRDGKNAIIRVLFHPFHCQRGNGMNEIDVKSEFGHFISWASCNSSCFRLRLERYLGDFSVDIPCSERSNCEPCSYCSLVLQKADKACIETIDLDAEEVLVSAQSEEVEFIQMLPTESPRAQKRPLSLTSSKTTSMKKQVKVQTKMSAGEIELYELDKMIAFGNDHSGDSCTFCYIVNHFNLAVHKNVDLDPHHAIHDCLKLNYSQGKKGRCFKCFSFSHSFQSCPTFVNLPRFSCNKCSLSMYGGAQAHRNTSMGRYCALYGCLKYVLTWISLLSTDENRRSVIRTILSQSNSLGDVKEVSMTFFIDWLLRNKNSTRPGLGRAFLWIRRNEQWLSSLVSS